MQGFIGLEMAENLVVQGIDVTIVEATPQVLPPLDPELAILAEAELAAHAVHVKTGATVASVGDTTVTLADGRTLPAELVMARSVCDPMCDLRKRPAWSSDRAAVSLATTALSPGR